MVQLLLFITALGSTLDEPIKSGLPSAQEILLTSLFAFVNVVYLFTFLFLIVRPSPLSDYRLPKILLGTMSFFASVTIALRHFKLVSDYTTLALILIYTAAYSLGIRKMLKIKKQIDAQAQIMIKKMNANNNNDQDSSKKEIND